MLMVVMRVLGAVAKVPMAVLTVVAVMVAVTMARSEVVMGAAEAKMAGLVLVAVSSGEATLDVVRTVAVSRVAALKAAAAAATVMEGAVTVVVETELAGWVRVAVDLEKGEAEREQGAAATAEELMAARMAAAVREAGPVAAVCEAGELVAARLGMAVRTVEEVVNEVELAAAAAQVTER